jgi:hypothetical protein
MFIGGREVKTSKWFDGSDADFKVSKSVHYMLKHGSQDQPIDSTSMYEPLKNQRLSMWRQKNVGESKGNIDAVR